MGFFSDLLSIAGPIAGAVIGGATGGIGAPLGAAIGGGISSLARGGSPFDAVKSGGLAYAGASIPGLLGFGGSTGAASAPLAGAGSDFSPEFSITDAGTAGLAYANSSAPLGDLAMLGSTSPSIISGGGIGGFSIPGLSGINLGGLSNIFSSAGGSNAAVPWGSPGNLLTMGSGLYGLYNADQMRKLTEQLSLQADPFAAYRPGYASQLAALQADPSQIQKIPGYQAGLDAVTRSLASQGYLGSGNMMAALAQYGGQVYQQQFNNLAGLSGATANPAGPAQIDISGLSAANQLAGSSLGTLGYGATMATPGINPNLAILQRLGIGVPNA